MLSHRLFLPLLAFAWLGSLVQAALPSGRVTLEQAYDRTLVTDQAIRRAFLEVRKARLEPWSALTRIAPTLRGTAGYGRSGASVQNLSSLNGTSTLRTRTGATDADITLTQPLIDLRVFPEYRLGKLTAQAAKLAHRFSIRRTLFGVASAYYEVLKQQRLTEVNEATLRLSQEQLDLAEKRFNVGEVTRSDVLRARVSVESSRRIWLESRNLLESNRNTLRNILNYAPDAPLEVVEPTPASTSIPAFETLLQTAYAHREDLLARDLAVQQDVERRKAVIASYAPVISSSASAGANNVAGTSRSRRNDWDLSVGVTVPFFTGGQRELDLLTARYQIEQTRQDRDQAAKDVETEVKKAWLDVHTLEATLTALKSQVAAAEQSYSDLQNQYRSGTATAVDVLSALNDLDISRKDLAIQTYDYEVALRNVEQASGVFQQPRVQKALVP